MILPAISIWEKPILHSGTLMKYLEDLIQEIKYFLPSMTTPDKIKEWIKNEYMRKQIVFPITLYTHAHTGTCTHTECCARST